MKKTVLLVSLIALSGCAITPENIQESNNIQLCHAMVNGKGEEFIMNEIERRKIDCATVLAAWARQKAATNQAIQSIQPERTHCTRTITGMNCTAY